MTPKIKVVHLVNSLSLDGTGKVVLSLCQLFDHNRFDISIVSLTPNIDLTRSEDWPKNVKVYTFTYKYVNDYSLRKYLILYFFRKELILPATSVRNCIKELSPDILHCHLQPRELLIVDDLKSIPHLLFTDHTVRIKIGQYPWINIYFLAWVYRRILKKFNVTAVSPSVAECHRKFKLINKRKVYALIENAIDTIKFSPVHERPSHIIRIIYIARFDSRKGHEDLVRAWSKISENYNLELVLLGTGETEEKIKSLVTELKPRHNVVFAGSQPNVIQYLNTSNIAVFPSRNEGLPLALLEKMSSGLPVIVSDINEFTEILTDNENCLFFKKGDYNDLYEKLILLIRDTILRLKIGESARQFVVENFDVRIFIKKYEKVYKEILDSAYAS